MRISDWSSDVCSSDLYGVDLRHAESQWRDRKVKARLTELCDAMGSLGAWVRLHYVYPYPHVDEIIPLMAEGKLLPYLDIPFQHEIGRASCRERVCQYV